MIVPFFISHLGCPHQCLFCNQKSITGVAQPLPSPETIHSTIADFSAISPEKPVEVAFFGGTFTMLPPVDQERLLGPLQPLMLSGKVSAVRISTRPDAIDVDSVAFLERHGVRTVELGVQSFDHEVLVASKRGHTASDVSSAVAILHAAGLSVGIQLMPGLPSSSPEKDIASIDQAVDLAPDFLRIYPSLVLAGTGLARLYESGAYRPLSLEAAVSLCAAMLHRCLRANLPVIRMGLQASDALEEPGNILAGPYHPAFRQLVESELCYYLLSRLANVPIPATKCVVRCAPSRVSDVAGQRRANLERLAATGTMVERIEGDASLSPMELILLSAESERRGNLHNDLQFDHEGKLYV